MTDPTDRTAAELPAVATLSYEQARDELVTIVARLEGGQLGLEDSMTVWERGEALAEHCTRWLDGAQARLQRTDDAAAEPVVDSEQDANE